MSTEEDLELRDLVTQALESNGVLSKIRAELRASVFLALEEQDLLQTETSYANKSFKNFIKTSEGMLLTQLVREFLEFFELDFTLSVFDPETSYGKDYEFLGRNTLVKELKMKNINGDGGPLLAQILKIASRNNESDKEMLSSVKEEMDKVNITGSNDDTIIQKKNVKNSQSNVHIDDSNKPLVEQSVETTESSGRTYSHGSTFKDSTVQSAESVNSDENDEFVLKPKKHVNEESKKNDNLQINASQREEDHLSSDTNDLMSLSNLPPLSNTNKSKTETLAPISNSRRDINQLKTMINSLEVAESNYDEDFLSSASGSCVEGRSGRNSLPGSETEEIEEDIGSGIDDLLSNASVLNPRTSPSMVLEILKKCVCKCRELEDMTVDATVSNVSGLGDYMENV